jgi:hypothetical protein
MTPNEQQLHCALVEIRSAVADLNIIVTKLAWGSTMSAEARRIGAVEKSLAEAGKTLDAMKQQSPPPEREQRGMRSKVETGEFDRW